MGRVLNHHSLLVQWACSVVDKPYVWGETDCGTLTREGLRIILGKDPFPGVPSWYSEEESRKIWFGMGGPDEAFLKLGAIEIDKGYIQTGDVAILEIGDMITACLAINDKLLFSTSDKGTCFKPLRQLLNLNNIRFYKWE